MSSAIENLPTLSVCCFSGLGNRLRVLVSGAALAEATGRRLKCFWPRTDQSGALFSELFESDLDVVGEEPPDIGSWRAYGEWFDPPVPDLLQADAPHLRISTSDWLLQPRLYPAQAAHSLRSAAILGQLRPSAYVGSQVQAFRTEHFRTSMIGVHLRRGDFLRTQPGSAANTAQALGAVAAQLKRLPDAGILLCTDDGAEDPWTGQPWQEGVRGQFIQRFGSRVVSTTPRSLDRRQPEAVQDALIELLLLRQTQAIVGTARSSFSEMAMFGRPVPKALCSAGTAPLLRATRLDRLVQRAIFQKYKRDIPVRILYYHYTERPRWWLRGQLQQHWPGLYHWLRARRGLPND